MPNTGLRSQGGYTGFHQRLRGRPGPRSQAWEWSCSSLRTQTRLPNSGLSPPAILPPNALTQMKNFSLARVSGRHSHTSKNGVPSSSESSQRCVLPTPGSGFSEVPPKEPGLCGQQPLGSNPRHSAHRSCDSVWKAAHTSQLARCPRGLAALHKFSIKCWAYSSCSIVITNFSAEIFQFESLL